MFGGFMPHGMCFAWRPDVLLLHVVSDAAIAAAYFSIPPMLIVFARRRRDLPFTRIFWMFGTFIVACGSTHVMSIWTIWHPDYWVDGAIKAVTALASMGTAVALVPLLPRLLALRGPRELEALNAQLAAGNADLELAKAEAEATIDRLDDGIVVFDSSMRVIRHNAAAERIFQADAATIERRATHGTFVDVEGEAVETARLPVAHLLATGERQIDVTLGIGPAGDGRAWLAASARAVHASTDRLALRVVLCVRDVTNLIRRELEQREYAQQLRSLHAIANFAPEQRREVVEAALRLALDQLELDWAYYGTFDEIHEELVIESSVGSSDELVLPATTRLPLRQTVIGHAIAKGDVITIPDLDHANEDFELAASGWGCYIAVPIFVENARFGAIGFVGRRKRDGEFTQANVEFVHVTRDLIASALERNLQRQRLDALAFSDPLTGLANRSLLGVRLDGCLAEASRRDKKFALLFIDLDDFKPVNDRGHAAGDAVLCEVARTVSNLVRAGETVARVGGDEFVILAPETRTRRDAAALARRVVDAIARMPMPGGITPRISASVGVSFYPDDGRDADSLIERADVAMLEAKSAGKGCVRFADEIPVTSGPARREPCR